MAKKTNRKELISKLLSFDVHHNKRLFGMHYKAVENVFNKSINEVSKLLEEFEITTNEEFYLKDYPDLKKRLEDVQTVLYRELKTAIRNSINTEWRKAVEKSAFLYNSVRNNGTVLYEDNIRARYAFLRRNISNGSVLSDKIWNVSRQFLTNIENTISVGVARGDDALSIAIQLTEYLRSPSRIEEAISNIGNEMLRLKVRDRVELSYSRVAHSGQYKSSLQNALRLSVTETNMAYRNSENIMWKSFDFVVGYEIILSNNHPRHDICDELNGVYPKDIIWDGWHPWCRCYKIPVLKTEEELAFDDRLIAEGKEPMNRSVNTVDFLPKKFIDWYSSHDIDQLDKQYFFKRNKDRIQRYLSLL